MLIPACVVAIVALFAALTAEVLALFDFVVVDTSAATATASLAAAAILLRLAAAALA